MAEPRALSDAERVRVGLGCGALVVLAGMASLGSAVDAMCETTTYAESVSPSGGTAARVQMTDCGATTGFSRVVWVQRAWLPQDRWLSCRAAAFDGQPSVALDWSADALIVSTDAPHADVIAVAASCSGVPITVRFGSA